MKKEAVTRDIESKESEQDRIRREREEFRKSLEIDLPDTISQERHYEMWLIYEIAEQALAYPFTLSGMGYEVYEKKIKFNNTDALFSYDRSVRDMIVANKHGERSGWRGPDENEQVVLGREWYYKRVKQGKDRTVVVFAPNASMRDPTIRSVTISIYPNEIFTNFGNKK